MLILASQSPRRRDLMQQVGLEFLCIPSDADETIPEGMAPEAVPEYLAEKKAEAVWQEHPEDTVIGSDTLVLLDGKALGKPHTPEEAFAMLRELSGRVHHVYTGVAILGPRGVKRTFTTATEIEFYPLTDAEIWDYIRTGEPMDKAGAYGIQGIGALLVKGFRGDYYTVVGLPIAEVVRTLRSMENSGDLEGKYEHRQRTD